MPGGHDGLAGARADGRADDIVMVAIVTFVATWLAVGIRSRTSCWQWAKAFVVAWPIAATTAFFVMPSARRLAERLLRRTLQR